MSKAMEAVLVGNRDLMNKEINKNFEYIYRNEKSNLQTIVDCALMASFTHNHGCLNDCIINLHAIGDNFNCPHSDRTIAYAALEKVANLKNEQDLYEMMDLLRLAGFYTDSQFIQLMS
jgi:hypothetical protein